MRVVALTCSNTEIVCALGCADQLVGVDDHSDYPPEVVGALPRVGPDLKIDVDAVAALEPDLVLASLTVPGHEEVVERLAAAGLPWVAYEPNSLADVRADVLDVARRLGVPERGEELVARMDAAMAVPGDAASTVAERPRILLQWWPKPVIAPGRRSWIHEMIERAGGANPLGDEDVKSRPLEDEEVRRLAPDAVVLSWCGVEPHKVRPDVVLNNPVWQDLDFVRRGRVFRIPEAYVGRPSPRLAYGLRLLRRVVETVGAGESGAVDEASWEALAEEEERVRRR